MYKVVAWGIFISVRFIDLFSNFLTRVQNHVDELEERYSKGD